MTATKSAVPRPSADELRRLYVDEKKGCPEIGRMFGRGATTIRNWLVESGVEMCKRGHDPALWFENGEPSAYKGRRSSADTRRKVRVATTAEREAAA